MRDSMNMLMESISKYCDDKGVCCTASSSGGPLGDVIYFEFSRKNKALRSCYGHYTLLQNVNWIIDQIKYDIDKLVKEAEQ